MPVELSTIIDATLRINGGRLGLPPAYSQQFQSFNVKAYGAVCDGTTDDSDAYQAACDAAAAATYGGVVTFPPGKIRIRAGRLFSTSTHTGGLHSVYLRGGGVNETIIVWDPLDDDDYLARWYTNGDYYAGGGAEDLLVICAKATATGPVFHVTGGYTTRFNNVAVFGYGNSGGTGLLVDYDGFTTQHLTLQNVMIQGLDVGMDIFGVEAMSAYELKLNQNTTATGIMRGGSLVWYGGLVQGNQPFEFRPVSQNSIKFRASGLYCEIVGSVNTFKAYEVVGTGYGGQIKICDCTNNGSYTFLNANNYDLHLADINAASVTPVLTAVNCALIGVNLNPDPAMYSLDTYTQTYAHFINAGGLGLGTAAPNHPITSHLSAVFGAPVKLASVTPTQRDALSGVVEDIHLYNNVAKVPQFYNGTRWRSAGEPKITDVWPLLLHHFDSRKGIGSNTWADMIGSMVLTGTNTPVHGADGNRFNGNPVWQFVAASSQLMDTGGSGSTIFASGATGFYVRMIARRTTALGSGFGTFVNLANNAADAIMGQVMDYQDDAAFEGFLVSSRTNFGPPPANDSLVHKFEVWLAPDNTRFAVDGTVIASGGVGVTTTANIQRITIGGFPGYSFYGNFAIADLKIAAARPTGDIALAVAEMDYDIWGYEE